jgi:delta14-sterol reductase
MISSTTRAFLVSNITSTFIMAKSKVAKLAEYEFFGPPGAAVISFFLPVLCYVFAFVCNDVSGCPAPSLLHPYTSTLDQIKEDVGWPGISGLLNTKAFIATLGYYALSFVLYGILPAEEHEGTVLEKSGLRMKYRFNGEHVLFYLKTELTSLASLSKWNHHPRHLRRRHPSSRR